MKAKEKAKELVDRYYIQISNANPLEDILVYGKKCALICVDEMLKVLWHNHEKNSEKMYRYYLEVKQEINKL